MPPLHVSPFPLPRLPFALPYAPAPHPLSPPLTLPLPACSSPGPRLSPFLRPPPPCLSPPPQPFHGKGRDPQLTLLFLIGTCCPLHPSTCRYGHTHALYPLAPGRSILQPRLLCVFCTHLVLVQMDEEREAGEAAKGLLTLAEVPPWVTHDAAPDQAQQVPCLQPLPYPTSGYSTTLTLVSVAPQTPAPHSSLCSPPFPPPSTHPSLCCPLSPPHPQPHLLQHLAGGIQLKGCYFHLPHLPTLTRTMAACLSPVPYVMLSSVAPLGASALTAETFGAHHHH